MSSIKQCLDEAVRAGEIDQDEADAILKRHAAIMTQMRDAGKAKSQLSSELAAEAAERKRRALLTETARKAVVADLDGFRNDAGDVDLPKAFLFLHEHFGQATFKDVEHARLAIIGEAHAELDGLLQEFRRGAITGDLKRTSTWVGNAKTQARMSNVVRELFGEGSGDANAKALADAWSKVAEDLRVRFNEAGGGIGKLEKWGLPQFHDQAALIKFGQAKWVEHMMQPDVLDRSRMINPITKRVMSDAELRESLGVVWERITSDGWSDRKITGAPVGRGALWSQHADHRFLHFKNADAWLRYAKDFGNPDPYHAMMAHIGMMARDIAAMERFGPNPEVTRAWAKQYIQQKASSVKSVDVIVKEQTDRLKDLASRLSTPNPDYVRIVDRIGEVHSEMIAIRRKYAPQLGGKPSARNQARLDALNGELQTLEKELSPYRSGAKPMSIEDTAVAEQLKLALDDLRDPITFAPSTNPAEYAARIVDRADDIWALYRGTLNTPVDSRIARFMSSARNFITAASLGAAQLSAISDVAFGAIRRGFAGMDLSQANPGKVLVDTVRYIGTDNRREVVRSGLILDSALNVLHQQSRYAGSIDTRSITGFLADRTIALQGLAAWTQAGKHAFGMALQGLMADVRGMSWGDLPQPVREMLSRHGITEAGDGVTWDQIRAAAVHEPKPGAQFLRATEIEKTAGRAAAEAYLMMLLRETRFAVPEATLRSRSVILGGTKPGTFAGELARSFGQFKGFGVAVVMLHLGQIVRDWGGGRRARSMEYAAAMLLTSTLLGVLAASLKDIKDGRDPKKWLDKDTYADLNTWGAAILQAGGLGIYGDFLFSNVNRFGGGLTSTVAGPIWERIDNIRNLTIGNAIQAIQGKETRFAAETIRFLRGNSPLLSLWYTRLAYERMVLDRLQLMVDRDARSAFQRQVSQRRREYAQDYWWAPGAPAPDRGPDLGAAFKTQ